MRSGPVVYRSKLSIKLAIIGYRLEFAGAVLVLCGFGRSAVGTLLPAAALLETSEQLNGRAYFLPFVIFPGRRVEPAKTT